MSLERIQELAQQGLCCSQIMVLLALEASGREEPGLVQAMHAYGWGLYNQELCGTLAGAVAVLSLFDKKGDDILMIPEFVRWFKQEFGGANCREIIGEGCRDFSGCLSIMAASFAKLQELLLENGIVLEEWDG